MNDDASKNGEGDSIKRIAGWISAAIGFITSLLAFVRLVQKEAEIFSIIVLVIGIALLWGSLFYIRFKKITIGEGLGHPRRVPAYSDRARRSALIGIFVVPLLVVTGFIGWKYYQNRPSDKVVILIADFDEPGDSYGVTKTIFDQLEDATKEYDDVEVQALDEIITAQQGSSVARAWGEEHKANIVIWGWYIVPGDSVRVVVHFEVLKGPESLSLRQEANRQNVAVAELEGLQIHTRLSNEMHYMTLLTIGLARYEVEDYDGAIERFTDALDQPDVPEDMVDPADIYFYRGIAYYKKGEYDRVIADYDHALALNPEYAYAYNNRGTAYYKKGEYDRAIADLERAIELDPNNPITYANRGRVYQDNGDYDRALA